jgi:hypothetical protein
LSVGYACSKTYDEIHIVGLYLCLVRRTVSDYRAAFIASVDYNVASLRIGLGAYRAQNAAAGIGTVAGVYVNVKRAKTEGAMIS